MAAAKKHVKIVKKRTNPRLNRHGKRDDTTQMIVYEAGT